ncbi:hypothetical protein [Aeromonas jandaei]|uniref:hypothetical protein n=1 Tax=Aeromonas jandaei TaxID=650 RepID=UPI003BA3101C
MAKPRPWWLLAAPHLPDWPRCFIGKHKPEPDQSNNRVGLCYGCALRHFVGPAANEIVSAGETNVLISVSQMKQLACASPVCVVTWRFLDALPILFIRRLAALCHSGFCQLERDCRTNDAF